ncbi:hypothetical protein ZEAMMB73_Zm00001d047872 [Zea mays]|uniref:Replication protein A DNA-binding subunit B n=1 Tax=Zea mays TaxID=4577 RepID=A0A1D6PE77_MAIZE|nr:hypothetical protein ZEAMMB73_Zm00001d047872 [Zea mays]
MLFTPVAELHPQSTNVVIRVRVIRKWEFRGATNDGPLQYINLVLADEQGTPIHAEIAAALAVDKGSLIEIEKVYELKRFRVTPSRNYFKPVDNNFMIQFTLYTQAKVVKDPPQVFPRYIYKLTCFENIEDNIDNRTYLIDVLGMLTQINPPHLIGYNNSTIIRDIFIENTSDMSLKITLWGNQASSFSISDVYNQSNNQPIVILLVGFLAKRFKGQPYLSSTTASSWYFNPGIPEAQTYYNRLQTNDLQLIQPTAAEEEILLSQPPNLEQKTVEELLNIDPDMFPPEGYRCTVTISRIVQNSKWWYPSCSRCHKSSSQTSTGYHCTSCGCTDINFRYKLSFIATDGTCEAEFFCFDSIARKIVGKPCDNLVTAAATSQGPPAALVAIVCLKFTLVVTINMSAYSVTNRVFSVLSILTNHGRQTFIPSNMPSHPQQELDTQDEIPSLPTTQDSPATSMAKLSTCSNERNEGDAQRISELNNEELSSPPKRYLLIAHLSRATSLLDHECFPIDMNPIKSTITFGP